MTTTKEQLRQALIDLSMIMKAWSLASQIDSQIRQIAWNHIQVLVEIRGRIQVCSELGITPAELEELVSSDWTKTDVPAQLLETYLKDWMRRP